MRKYSVIITLAIAQFVLVLDSTVMNVSINEVVTDLDTTVTEMQLAITLYTLVMAAFMLTGGKIGDILGRRRTWRIGVVIFAIGAGTTAAAPNIEVLMAGWSVAEGIGSTLIIPASAALVAGNYVGRDRAMAYGILGGIGAAAAAAGPIIGGWVATAFSWRWVFAAEVVIMAVLLLCSGFVKDTPRAGKVRLDGVGSLLSALGFGMFVLGIVQSTTWGWIQPKQVPSIAGVDLTPFGISLVPFLIVAGALVVGFFIRWEQRVDRRGGDALLRLELFSILRLRAGLLTLGVMYLILAGTFFAMPLYLQIVLGNDPLDTGLKILPLSLGLFFVAMSAAKLSSRFAPRLLVRLGLGVMLLGVVVLMATISLNLDDVRFSIAMLLLGAGLGLMASQLGNNNQSSVPLERSSEVGGLQGTAQNLGSALGTALIGAVLLSGLLNAFTQHIQNDDRVPSAVTSQILAGTTKGVPFLSATEAQSELEKAGLPASVATDVVSDYTDAQVFALKVALLGVGMFTILGFWFTRRLPREPLAGDGSSQGDDDAEESAPAAAGSAGG